MKHLGQALLDAVEPAIYATTLDFSTIETMSEARERIGEKLARKRLRKGELDVKLARGGIRDIEFLVQCLQRLHGGREPWVRHGGTLLALTRLHDKDLLSQTEYQRLVGAYEFLRYLEHRLQFEDDRQTHSLPANPVDLDRIARRMPDAELRRDGGITASAQLLGKLNHHLENVQAIYESIVHAQRPLYYGPAPAAASATDAPSKTQEERRKMGVADKVLRSVAEAAPQFAERLRTRGVHRSEEVLAEFLEKLLNDSSGIRLLDEYPLVADCMVQIFELSPYLSGQLLRYPELLEEIRRAADQPGRRWAYESLSRASERYRWIAPLLPARDVPHSGGKRLSF